MNRRKTTLFLVLAILLSACSSVRSVNTPSTESSISVDGTLTDWNMEQSLVDQTDAVNFYATHDNEYLYVYVDVKSLAMNNAMRNSGFIIYLGSKEDTRKNVGIAFPSGAFNLLREDPVTYNSMLNDNEWLQNPRNRELLESLKADIFDRIMIVEDTGSGKDYGFINKDQLQIDGIQIAAEDSRRLIGIEMRVPLDEASFYNLNGNKVWMGFEIDPPDFRHRDNESERMGQQRYGNQRQRGRNNTNRQAMIRQQMGQYEQWYLLNLEQ